MIAFCQPYGLGSPGGGARILRAMLPSRAGGFFSVCTSTLPPPDTELGPEIHVPPRRRSPDRLEQTRIGFYLDYATLALRRTYARRLSTVLHDRNANAVNVVPHDLTFPHACEAARRLGLPYSLTVNDDLAYALAGRPGRTWALECLGRAWREAASRVAWTEALAEEYCRRYGRRPYTVVMEGLERVADQPRAAVPDRLHVYFMGLMHLSYEPNLIALMDALDLVREQRPELEITLTCRCGWLSTSAMRKRAAQATFPVTVLPFASEGEVDRDLADADFLYVPLPFDREHDPLVRFSFPTKIITYLGSGLPILYHGPSHGNAFEVVGRQRTGFSVDSLDPALLVRTLLSPPDSRQELTVNALALARRSFLLEDQRKAFWHALDQREAA
jgi:hypothetical protein